MTIKPSRLQGTDGIRGRITNNRKLDSSNPIDYFLNSNLLTPAFFERYTFAFGTLLIESGLAKKNESIVVGWDPRDHEGLFNQAAIRGIRKSGLKAIVIGTLPTPAIPLFMQFKDAIGSVVLTASHNPADQNGIKLFCGQTALKFLPTDDHKLTALIYSQQSLDINRLEESGGVGYQEQEAKDFFVKFCLDSRNSWIDTDEFHDTILVLDASNGAVAEVVREVFADLPFKEVVFTNMEGNINEYSGVADIEGLETITRESVTLPGAKFSSYKTLVKLFEKSTILQKNKAAHLKLVAFVFDGDGDRCFRLDYIPESDSLHVSSGDLLGIHQARYIRKDQKQCESLFINTVESDLNTAITARNLGFTPILTGVGDKWILSRAVVDLISSRLPKNEQVRQQFNDLLGEKNGLSALKVSKFWKQISEKHSMQQSNETKFRIGIEESGHCITPGFLEKNDEILTTFSGNGIKTALNTLKSLVDISSADLWYSAIKEPFLAGVGKTFYTYFVDKAHLNPGSSFRNQLQNTVQERFFVFFTKDFELEITEFAEEKEMLYCSILEKGKQCGAIFMRNSGTEDKSALYLRGELRLSTPLQKLGSELHLFMLQGLKDPASEFTGFEIELLKALRNKETLDHLITSYPGLPHERIYKEMEFKEGLISKEQGSFSLTGKGKQFIDSWV